MFKKDETSKKKKEKQPKVICTVKELIPIAYYDTTSKSYVLTDHRHMDMFRVKTKDLANGSPDDYAYDVYRLEKFYKTIGEDIKLIALNYPCDTSKQVKYFEHLIKKTKNSFYLKFLERKRDELVWLGKNTATREFIFMIWAKNKDDLDKLRANIKSCLGTDTNGLMENIPAEVKHSLLRKLCNKNLMIN